MHDIKKFFLSVTLIFIHHLIFAQTSIQIENSALSLNIFTLQNGLTVFVIPDKSNALVSVELVNRAGFSAQNQSTCGFFSMLARLHEFQMKDYLELHNGKWQCNSDSTKISLLISAEELEDCLEILSDQLSGAVFSDKEIKTVHDQMKKESTEYSQSTSGFINSSIDSRVFHEQPWKHDSGIYPSLFSSYSVSQIRTILSNISAGYYTPDGSALFISGNIDAKSIGELCESNLGSWKPGSKPQKSVQSEKTEDKDGQRKFVIVSDQFSKELTQIVVQYTSMNMNQCDLAAAAMNQDESVYKTAFASNPVTAIRSTDYIAATTAHKNGTSRLILQALMEEPYFFSRPEGPLKQVTAAEQGDTFIEILKSKTEFTRKEFINSQNMILEKHSVTSGNGRAMSSLLTDYWPYAKWTTPEDFYKGFQDITYGILNVTENEVLHHLRNEEPFLFLLVNKEKYEKQKKDFLERGYEKIDEKNSSWWKNDLLAKKAKAEKKHSVELDKTKDGIVIRSRPSEIFYANSIKNIKEKKLSNGIPVTVKENKGSQTVCISTAISGGMLASPVKEKNLRSILVSAAAKNSHIGNVTSETLETVSYITCEVLKDNLEQTLDAISNALIYGEITPVQADRLFADESYSTLMKNADLGTQMRNNVFAYLLRDTNPGQIFRDYDNKYNSASYQSLLSGYTEFLDASLYSIVICGDVSYKEAFSAAEKSFGRLKAQNERKKWTFPELKWKNRQRNIQLRHLYSSDLPPELAPKESPLLVPTKEFLDPVQLYFKAPDTSRDIMLFNALLMELASRIDKETESYCISYDATKNIPAGYIHGNKIKKADTFFKIYEEKRNELLEELEDKEKSGKCIRTIKSRYEIKILEKTDSNTGNARLIQDGITEGNFSEYLNRYLELENADAEKFIGILDSFIQEEPMMKVFSVDGKK